MTDDPYLAAELAPARQQTNPAGRTYVFSWRALGVAMFIAVLFSTTVAVAEKHFQPWTYTSRVQLAMWLTGFPPSGGVLPPINELTWTILSTTCIHLPYLVLTLLVFVPLFLRLCRPKPGRSEQGQTELR